MLVSNQSPVNNSIQVYNDQDVNFFELLPPEQVKMIISFMDTESKGNTCFLNKSLSVIATNYIDNLPLVFCAKQVMSDLYNPEYATTKTTIKRYTDKNEEEKKIVKSDDTQRFFNWLSKEVKMPEVGFFFIATDLTMRCKWPDSRVKKMAGIIGFHIERTNDPYTLWKIYGKTKKKASTNWDYTAR